MSSFLDAIARIFSADGFVPRRVCGLWPDWLVWEHVAGNALVWVAYVAMPLMIWRLGVRRRDWAPFRGVVRAFALFIGLCGLGHFLDMLAFFYPMYRFSGHVLIATGLASAWAAWSIRRAWPALMALQSPAELERIIAERTAELTRAIGDLERAEAERSHLATIVESSHEAIIGKDLDGVITAWNGGAERLFGFTAAEAIGRPISLLIAPERGDEQRAILDRLRRGDRVDHFETSRVTKDGRSIDVSLSISPIRDRAGQIVGISKIARDITERRRAEEARRSSERIYRAIGESIAFGVWICDAEGRNTYASESFLRLVGLTQEQCSEFGWSDMIHPDDVLRTIAAWEACVRDEGTWDIEHRFRGTDGEWHPVLVRGVPVRDEEGRIVCWAGINLDISRLRAAEAAWRQGEERQRLALAAARLSHWEWDILNDRITHIDALGLYGRPDDRPFVDYAEYLSAVPPEDRQSIEDGMARALAMGAPYEAEYRIRWPDGSVHWLASRGATYFDIQGNPNRMIGVNLDITERKNSEAQIRRLNEDLERRVSERTAELAEANEALRLARDQAMAATSAKSEFLANMSHEIRTPMNGVIGMTDLLLGTGLDYIQREYVETIRSGGEALLTVINDILDFSKIEAGKLTVESIEFDLRTLMEEVAELLAPRAHQKGLEINCRVDPALPSSLLGDPSRIRQVLTNLAGNAVKFTQAGQVNLEARPLAEAGGEVTLRVLVRDTGIGIPAGRQADVFESFTQVEGGSSRRHGGTGLGLTICRSLVDLMGGRIGLESAEGEGSTFWFDLTLGRGIGVPEGPLDDLLGLRVLFVDDHESNRAIVGELLLGWGCRPDVAGSGAEALARLFEAREGEAYGLIILDREMPGLDGEQTARAIKSVPRLAGVPILLLTSPGMPGSGGRAEGKFSDATLTKPVRRSQLHRAIRRAIADGEPSRGEPPVAAPPDGPIGVRVLMAEDNEVNRRVAIGMLDRLGCRVEVVENGRQALEALDYDRHDIVLMDIQMPEMDGLAASAAIREREKASGEHIPIIALTAHAMRGDHERCLEAGMDDYIAKPLRAASLREVLRSWAVGRDRRSVEPGGVGSSEGETYSAASLLSSLGGDPRLLAEILGLLLAGTPERLERMAAAIKQGDARQVSWEAHALKGAFLAVGAGSLASAFQDLMALGDRSDFPALESAYGPIVGRWEQLRDEVKTQLEAMATPVG